MKRFFALFLCIFSLTSCTSKNLPSQPDIASEQIKTEESSSPVETEISSQPETVSPDISEEKKEPLSDNVYVEDPVSEPSAQTVSIVVNGLDGEILFSATAPYREGITVFDFLLETAKEKNIPVVFTGGNSSPYVTSICGLSEKQHGPSSGWAYTVNGETIMKSCGKYVLNPGDVATWTYITEF